MSHRFFDPAGALRTVALVFGFELVVARMTAHVVSLHDVAVSAAAWLPIALGLSWVLLLFADRTAAKKAWPVRSLGWMPPILGRSPLSLLSVSFLLPVVIGDFTETSIVALILTLQVLVPPALRLPWFPSAAETVATLLAVTVMAFALDGRGWPELSTYLPLGFLWVVLAACCRGPSAAVALAALAAIGVTTPEPVRIRFDDSLPAARADAPDIYLLTLDTLRRDLAYEMTSVRAVAEQGVLFESAQSLAPWTLPSMATIMTGVSPQVHGAGHSEEAGETAIDPDLPTMGLVLAELGYDTVAVAAANPFVGQLFGFRKGFATFDHPSGGAKNALPRGFTLSDLVRPLMARVFRRHVGFLIWSGDDVLERVGDFLLHRRDRPLFLWMHFMDCHGPYQNLDALTQEVRDSFVMGPPHRQEELFSNRPERREAARAAYLNEVDHFDRVLQAALSLIDGSSSRPKIVVLVADHGEELFEHGRFGHGHQFYEPVIGVPLVIRGLPGVAPGSRVATPVGTDDLLPTLLRAVAAEALVEEIWQRERRRPADLRRPDPERILPSHNLLHLKGAAFQSAMRRGKWKALFADDGSPVLFDMSTDAGEQVDVSARHPEIVELLRPEPSIQAPPARAPAALTESERDALRQLGYGDPTD